MIYKLRHGDSECGADFLPRLRPELGVFLLLAGENLGVGPAEVVRRRERQIPGAKIEGPIYFFEGRVVGGVVCSPEPRLVLLYESRGDSQEGVFEEYPACLEVHYGLIDLGKHFRRY